MPRGGRSRKLRRDALREIEKYRLEVPTLGGVLAKAVGAHSGNWFTLARGLVDDQSSATDWVKNGVSAWIQCFKAEVDLGRDIGGAICKAPEEEGKPKSGVIGGQIFFYLDRYTQTTDPVEIGVPSAEIGAVSVQPGSTIPVENINVSVSADDKTVEVSLVQLGTGAGPLSAAGTYAATLNWPSGSQTITAIVTFI